MRHSIGKSARIKAASLLGIAGALVLGYALLQPAGSGKIPGWEPVNPKVEEALDAMDGTKGDSSSGNAKNLPAPFPSSSGTVPAETASHAGTASEVTSPPPADSASVPSADDKDAAAALPTSAALASSTSSGPPASPSPAEDGRFDLNAATVEQLDALKGIGPSKAKAIVDYRDGHGPFRRVDDLLQVKGIGEKLLAAIRPYVYVAG